MILVTCVCVCVFSSHLFWTSSSLDVPAGVTQIRESSHRILIPGLRAVMKLPREAVRERLARRRREKFRVLPSNGTGKRSRLCTAGWERDGKAGRQKVDGMGWELTISRLDGNGREIKRSGNKSGNRSGNKPGNKLGNKSGNTSGNTSACRDAQKPFRGFHHNCCFLCTLHV